MIAPSWFHMRYKQGRAYTEEAYANDEEYFKDVAQVYKAELETLYEAGLRNVQFDDPGMACKIPSLPHLHILSVSFSFPFLLLYTFERIYTSTPGSVPRHITDKDTTRLLL